MTGVGKDERGMKGEENDDRRREHRLKTEKKNEENENKQCDDAVSIQ